MPVLMMQRAQARPEIVACAVSSVYALRGFGCNMLTRFRSESKNETYRPTPGISIGSPSTSPPDSDIFLIAVRISATAMTTEGYCAGQSGFFGKKPPFIAPGFFGPFSSVSVVVARHSCPFPVRASGSASQTHFHRTLPCAACLHWASRNEQLDTFCS